MINVLYERILWDYDKCILFLSECFDDSIWIREFRINGINILIGDFC